MNFKFFLFSLLLCLTAPAFAQLPVADPIEKQTYTAPVVEAPAVEVTPAFDLTTKLAGSLTLLDSLQSLLTTLKDPASRAVIEQAIEKFKDKPEKAEGFEGWVNYITALALALGAALVYIFKFGKDRVIPLLRNVTGKKQA